MSRLKIVHADLFRHPLRCRRHDLHQTLRTHRRFGCGDKATLLPHQTINPCAIERQAFGGRLDLITKRRQVAQAVVMLLDRSIGGMNRTIQHALRPRKFGGGKQFAVAQVTHGP